MADDGVYCAAGRSLYRPVSFDEPCADFATETWSWLTVEAGYISGIESFGLCPRHTEFLSGATDGRSRTTIRRIGGNN